MNVPANYFQNTRSEMHRFIPEVSEVLELGCGEGRFMAGLRRLRPHVRLAVGIEPHDLSAKAAATVFDEVLSMPVEQAMSLLIGRQFDAVLANDVLEHLVDPWAVLRSLRTVLRPNGVLVASIPNIRHWPTLNALLLNGMWEYADSGVLDRTHLRFFTRSSLYNLFEQTGFRLEGCEGINGGKLPWKIGLLNRMMGGRFDDCAYLQFACVARVRHSV